MIMVPVRVECYAGYRAEEEPRVLQVGDKRLEVEQVVDRWHEAGLDPSHSRAEYFKLLCGSRLIIVKHDLDHHVWYLVTELPPRM